MHIVDGNDCVQLLEQELKDFESSTINQCQSMCLHRLDQHSNPHWRACPEAACHLIGHWDVCGAQLRVETCIEGPLGELGHPEQQLRIRAYLVTGFWR